MLQAKQQLQQSKEREAQISDLVHFLCQYSTTARSDSLFVQEARYFPGTSVEQQSRRKIYDELELADLVSVQLQDFVNLLDLCQIKTEKRQMDAEITLQKMIMLNQRNLLDDSHMLSFFKSLETSNIF